MRISKGTGWLALAASSTAWVWGCGDSASSGTSSAGGSSAHAGSASSVAGQAPSNAGRPGTMNGQAGSANGGSGDQPGGAPGAAGSASGSSGAISSGAPGTAGSSSAGSGSASAGAAGSGTPAKSAGCGKAAPLSAATQQTAMIDGTSRGYLLVPPTPYDKDTPYSVVFAFHGGGANGASFRPSFEAETANQAIFVYPDGAGGVWDLKNNGSDAKLFDSILATLSANWCIDSGAVFAFGFSYGGWAATQMASARPSVVRAIASVEGGGPQGSSNSDPPVAAMIIHGKNDTAEPLASGQSSRDHFLKVDGCGSTPTATTPSPCVTYDGCKPKKSSVVWCEHEGAHEVPGFAPAAIWSFFKSMR